MKTISKKVVKVEEVNEVQVINVTSKENLVLKHLIDGLYAEAGFSDIDCNDLAKSTKLSVSVVKGIIGSLTKKELVWTEKTNTFGAKQYDLVYLAPLAWGLHPTWKEESEHSIELKVTDSKEDTSKKSLSSKLTKAEEKVAEVIAEDKKTSKKSKSLEKNKDEEVLLQAAENTPNKPYSVYGIHGKNIDLEDYKKGDKVEFKVGKDTVVGEFVHFHVNNWSKNGYAVIKFNGKIYERVLSSITKVKEVVKKSTKKQTPSKVEA